MFGKGVVATSDIPADGAPSQVKPPSTSGLAITASGAARRHCGIDFRLFIGHGVRPFMENAIGDATVAFICPNALNTGQSIPMRDGWRKRYLRGGEILPREVARSTDRGQAEGMDGSVTSRIDACNLALDGRVALVTGSSRGIGAGIAARFAQEGAAVAVHGRDASAVEGVRDGILAAGGRAIAVIAELTEFEAIERMRDRVEQELGPIDILVANAGGNPTPPGPIEDVTEAEWHATIDANLTATFLTIKSFLPGMKARGRGGIVTMSSAAARRPTDMSPAPYGSAKAGIQTLTRYVALQAGPFGVRANVIAPETILTENNLQRIPGEVQEKLAVSHPVRRLGTPGDIAEAALFLVSDASGWITGTVTDIAGGSVLA